ncbi:FHA domain-containing protein [Teredinibacter sp. KSP-S5-2]|uniref:FHA domain-containing protein n=1 Tax=Teredinibacter sp. KSP-S5-2 TaxID=3034506 RepID=UPI002934E65F|nr:FHA domain-containing protein [Teredinibacter sp. KSP-S5-2]WNO09490.1 FHA domain-containing protein [Teredinibacter sp. KSP-S5-2]
MLKLQFKDKRQDPFWIMEKTFTIGRASDNHLVLDDENIADYHAKILHQDDTFLIKDLSTDAGTYVNGQRINQKPIVCGDVLSFGNTELEIIDPLIEDLDQESDYWSLIADSSWLSGQEFPLIKKETNEPIILGRGKQCDIVFPGTHLSRQHASVVINSDSITLRDLNSSNGTFVNDKKISELNVFPGDRIRLDVYSFRVFGPGIELPKSSTSIQRAIAPPEAEPNTPASEKKWKIKPTSPGNREEPTYKKQNGIIGWTVAFTIIAALIFAAYTVLKG